MKHLVNNALRTKNMIELLQAMGLNLVMNQVNCIDERVIFKGVTSKEADNLIKDLQALLENNSVQPAINRVTLAELIIDNIANATCSDSSMLETHRKSCLAVFNVLQMAGIDYAIEEEYLEIQLPSPAYGPLFSSLTYKYMSIEEGKIRFNIKEFLKEHKQELIFIDGKYPLVLAHSNLFENKKIFYAQKKLDEETVEVTPYFFVPNALTPPTYHFVLDTSGSMEGELPKVQKSVIQFAEALFQFQPQAVVHVTQFANNTKKLGSYRKDNFEQLSSEVNSLKAYGGTELFTTALKQLSFIMQSTQHNNVLLFTDGQDEGLNQNYSLEALEKMIATLQQGSPLIPARNKFFIISYHTSQPEILAQLAKAFNSPIIETDTPDFAAALSEKGKLQEWAAARELFTCRLDITGKSSAETKSEEYVCSYDMSGQFTPLAPKQCKNNETLHLTITDGHGQTLLDDKKSLTKNTVVSTLLPGTVDAALQHGMFTPLSPTQVAHTSTTPTLL